MFNENWEGKDLASFVKTTLAQQIQKSQIGNFNNTFGVSSLLSTVSKKTSEENKQKIADGIDMGYQVPKNIIPIVYGHVGMSNTQFDVGQGPSDIDAEITLQSVKMVISEGPIIGSAAREGTAIAHYELTDTIAHLQHVIVNDSYVIDPVLQIANFKDIKYEMTTGDGTLNKQSATLLETNPLLGVDIEALDDTTNDTLLNDLGDVTAAKGVNNVLYWNAAAGRWEAKSFNTLLNEAGATYDGGAGGDGGTGGSGGEGGTGGEGGVGPSSGDHHLEDDQGLRYTQWNPPPTHVLVKGTGSVVSTVTDPPTTPAYVVTGKGAPLREPTDTLPYFQSVISFADVDESIDEINAVFHFPDGIYKETTRVTKVFGANSTITLCGTERPITDSGDLNCLTPSVTVAEDGQSTTTKTRTTADVKVHLVLTTELCDREFILHETEFTISHLKNGPWRYPHSMPLSSMNAGAGHLEDGTQQLDALDGSYGDCNATELDKFDFKDWDLSDYLSAYPEQIVQASNEVKVYAWIVEGSSDYKTISTNTYLEKLSVCSHLDGYTGLYSILGTSMNPFKQFAPDHGFNYNISGPKAETGVDNYSLLQRRCEENITTGAFSIVKSPDPLLVWDFTTMGQPGDTGITGASGTAGDSGDAGTTGSVTVPTLDPIPFVTGKDSSYPGNGVAAVSTLSTIEVSNDDPSSTDTLTIAVSQGTLNAVTVPTGVTASGQNTESLVLIGANPDIQTCLDSGIEFSSTTATSGDVALTLTISSSVGSSLDNRSIRSQAVTEYGAPQFTITVTDYSAGTFLASVFSDGTTIMDSVTGVTDNDTTAGLIAGEISSYTSIPNWTATSLSNVVTVTGELGIGGILNGVQPFFTGGMGATISLIVGGVTPNRITQPIRNTGNLKTRFIPALEFTNTLDDTAIAFAQLAYRPPQGDGQSTLSEVGFLVGGRLIESPSSSAISWTDWKDTYNYSSFDYVESQADLNNWSNNPAWVFFDYLTNSVYGVGGQLDMDATQKEQLYNDIYNCSVWCNQDKSGVSLADCDVVIYGAESKFEVLQKISALANAKFVYLNGNPRLIYDGNAFPFGGYTPTVKKIVNQTNAGDMIYQSGSIDNLYNVINVNYSNKENFNRLAEVQYRNAWSITQYGERETTIDLWGCSEKQQALWHGAWVYETEAVNSEMVTYIAGWDHFDVLPGDLICLNDTLRVDTSTVGGRVTSSTSGTLTLDRDAGTGTIAVMDEDGLVQYGDCSGTSASVSGTFVDGAVWNVYIGDEAENFRIVAIEESEDGIYAVTAQKHDPDKYTRVWANTI